MSRFLAPTSLARVATALVMVGVTATASVGCSFSRTSACGTDRSGLPTCSVAANAVSSHPEASLAFPGSTVVSHRVQGQQNFFGQTNGANADNIFATTAPMAQVYSWYATWVADHGWRTSTGAGLGPIEVSDQAYKRGSRELLIVAAVSMNMAHALRFPIPTAVQTETLYETTYFLDPYNAR